LCPVSRLCRPASFGLAVIAPSRGVESPVPTGVHTLAWTAAGWVLWEPPEKRLVAFGADEPDSSEPAKGLKEGVFQMWGGGWVCEKKEDGCGEFFWFFFLFWCVNLFIVLILFYFVCFFIYLYIYIYIFCGFLFFLSHQVLIVSNAARVLKQAGNSQQHAILHIRWLATRKWSNESTNSRSHVRFDPSRMEREAESSELSWECRLCTSHGQLMDCWWADVRG